MPLQSEAFAQLHRETMAALHTEHPDWTREMFDCYEARLAALLRQLGGRAKPRQPRLVARVG